MKFPPPSGVAPPPKPHRYSGSQGGGVKAGSVRVGNPGAGSRQHIARSFSSFSNSPERLELMYSSQGKWVFPN